VPGLLPVWLYAFARMKERRAAKLAVGVGVAGAVGVAWFWPLLVTSGGWTGFLAALAAQSRAATRYQVWTQGWPALATSGYIAAGAMVIGLGLAGAMAVAEWRRRDGAGHPEARRFLWWWIGPMVVMGMVVFYTILPGYLLCYFPAVAIAVAAAVVRAAERLRLRLAVVVGVVALANGALFLSDWRWPQLELNAPALRRHDAELARLFAEVRRRYRPEEVVLAHENQWFAFGFRHFQYHLPEYETWLLARDPVLAAPYDRRLWRARHRRVEFVEELAPVGRRVVRFTPPASLTETNCARPVRVP